MWCTERGKRIRTVINDNNLTPWSIKISQNEKFIATGWNTMIKLWCTTSGEEIGTVGYDERLIWFM